MNTLQTIALSVVFLVAFLWVFYNVHKGRTKKIHIDKLRLLEQEIRMRKSQIYTRDQGLKAYDFLEYNISEALVIQPDIRL